MLASFGVTPAPALQKPLLAAFVLSTQYNILSYLIDIRIQIELDPF